MDILKTKSMLSHGHWVILVTNAQPEHYDKAYKEWKLEDLPIIPKRMQTVVISKTSKQFKTVKSLILDKK